jgi:hypothetical protein
MLYLRHKLINKLSCLLSLLLSAFLVFSYASQAHALVNDNKSEKLKAAPDLSRLHIPFIENIGQIDKEVRYYAKTFSSTIFITKDGEIVYFLPEIKDAKISSALVLKEEIIGGVVKDIKGEKLSTTKVACFSGNDPSKWKRDIPAYEFVHLGEVYKNIEIKLRAYGDNVEKLLYVNPGADPDNIKLGLKGAKSVRIDNSGQLEIKTVLGTVAFTKPLAYQEINGKRIEVSVDYILKNNDSELVYGFKIGKYDKTRPLIIDPLLTSTLIGGNSDEYAYSIALDPSGNVYIGGYTMSMYFPAPSGALTNFSRGGSDIFIAKLDSDLTSLLASTLIGGSGDEYAYSIALDPSGNVYIGGYTTSMDFPTTSGALTNFSRGGSDIFISKLDSDLTSLLASTLLGGSSNEYAYSIALDPSGNVYIGGYTTSMDFPTTSGAFSTSLNNMTADAFISKLDSDLTSLLASTLLGGNDIDYVRSMAIFSEDDLISDDYYISDNYYISVAGNTYSHDFPTTSEAYDTFLNGKADSFISLFDKDLKFLISSTFLGGSEHEYVSAVAFDSSGNIYVTGHTRSSDFPVTPGAYQISLSSEYSDIFVSKFDMGLMFLLASTYLGGSHSEYSGGIALGREQALAGSATLIWNAPTTNVDGTLLTDLSGYNVYYGTSSGSYDHVEHVGDSTTYTVYNLKEGQTYYFALTAYDFSGNESEYSNEVYKTIATQDLQPSFQTTTVYVAGSTCSSDFPVTPGAFNNFFIGKYTDAFITKLNNDLTGIIASTFLGGSDYEHASSIAINSSGDVYTTGSIYSLDFPKNQNCFIIKLDPDL